MTFLASSPSPWPPPQTVGGYRVRFATGPEDLDAVLRLRYEIFNLELGEGLAGSAATGLDLDPFDTACHHLMICPGDDPRPVGTYRMQTQEMARAGGGFYTSTLFTLDTLGPTVLSEALEIGRACIAKPHRNQKALFALWSGLAAYLAWNRKRYLFGCCSLTSQDVAEGAAVYRFLRKRGDLHPTLRVAPVHGCACFPKDDPGPDLPADTAIELPRLFGTYLRYGAKACGPPAIDREFKTIDFLVALDVEALDPVSRRMFFP
jgi:putative hemolysin